MTQKLPRNIIQKLMSPEVVDILSETQQAQQKRKGWKQKSAPQKQKKET